MNFVVASIAKGIGKASLAVWGVVRLLEALHWQQMAHDHRLIVSSILSGNHVVDVGHQDV